jgi:hypothetical protein
VANALLGGDGNDAALSSTENVSNLATVAPIAALIAPYRSANG